MCRLSTTNEPLPCILPSIEVYKFQIKWRYGQSSDASLQKKGTLESSTSFIVNRLTFTVEYNVHNVYIFTFPACFDVVDVQPFSLHVTLLTGGKQAGKC